MDIAQAISKALGVNIKFAHSLTGRVTVHVPETIFTGQNWHQRELKHAWHLPQYHRVSFASEPEALAFFLKWYLDIRLGLTRDGISGMYTYRGEHGMPLIERDEYLCLTKREHLSVEHKIEHGHLTHRLSVEYQVVDRSEDDDNEYLTGGEV